MKKQLFMTGLLAAFLPIGVHAQSGGSGAASSGTARSVPALPSIRPLPNQTQPGVPNGTIGQSSAGLGAPQSGIGSNNISVGGNQPGIGSNNFSIGRIQPAVSSDNFSPGTKQSGMGSNQAGTGADPFGTGTNSFGLGAKQFGVGSNQFGIATKSIAFNTNSFGAVPMLPNAPFGTNLLSPTSRKNGVNRILLNDLPPPSGGMTPPLSGK